MLLTIKQVGHQHIKPIFQCRFPSEDVKVTLSTNVFWCFNIVILYIYVLMLWTIKQVRHQHINPIFQCGFPSEVTLSIHVFSCLHCYIIHICFNAKSESPLLWLFKNTTRFHKPPSKQMRHQHIKAIFQQHHWPWLSIRKCKSHTSLTFHHFFPQTKILQNHFFRR